MVDVIKDESSYNPPMPESVWFKFPEGTTTIRLLSHSISFKNHYVKSDNKTYDCTGFVETCRWCQQGNKVRQRWAYLVLIRDAVAPAVKVAEVGYSIFGHILDLSKDADYGDPRGYDLKIVRKGTDKDTEYSVLPGKANPFSEKEMSLVKPEELDNVDKATDRLLSYYKREEGEESGGDPEFTG